MTKALPLAALLLALGCSPVVDAGQAQQANVPREHVQIVTRLAGDRPAWVVDRAAVIDDAREPALAARAADIEAATRDQLIVVTVPALGGLSIEEFGYALGNHWGVGQADLDNGVLVLVAPADKRARIEVGAGLEHVLSDERAKAILTRVEPQFRNGNFEGGVETALREIEGVLRAHPERGDAR